MPAAHHVLDVGHAGCRDVLKLAAEHVDWTVSINSGGTVVWADCESDAAGRLPNLRTGEWLSWIPGVQEACGKIALAESLQTRNARFWPHSWRVPEVPIQAIFEQAFSNDRGITTLIVKPDQGSQGSGIALAQSRQDLQRIVQRMPPEGAIVQDYIDQPLLLDGFKWDARIYVLMMPQEEGGHAVFLLEEGLVRVCTETYAPPAAENLQRSMVHLTNYSLNKFSEKYTHSTDPADGSAGCKRTLSALLQRLEVEKPPFSAASAWHSLGKLAKETASVISEQVSTMAGAVSGAKLSRCFHLLGLDVLFDSNGRPWLLEANYRPSMLVDEVHPMPGCQSRAEINRLFASEKRAGVPKWGRPCRCSLHPSLHEHQLCMVDVAAKLPAVSGALVIVQRARAGRDKTGWADGTSYRLV